MKITMVKKIKADGNPCCKSANVLGKLEKSGLIEHIDRVVAADEREPFSDGLALALKHAVDAAPFFIVENDDGSSRVYTAYFRFLQEVFDQAVSESEELSELMALNPELDFI
ncbi:MULTISPECIES: hypothetical protein [unclassified Coleofasciculus]|uniref:hypothetical protein n=1 Tax=unclassified Coleofasciculus TaxID=2692782 RepID=UPI0018823D89|nr:MULTISPECIES: hypothetical protein [unclassified Coleofasciculus]MBE9126300.1 hypothetical protein [Coleofasciculus sp. LEGE 07081]MBE9149219.1 hypothetical protein [Coleofasciculus sp. LEGE 07092]